MKGQLYIDNKDVFTELGVATLQGNYGELVAFPSSKTPDSNDWTEEDGKEFDLSSITLDSREFSLEFGFFSEWKFNDFVALLSDSSYHDFNFPHLGRTFRLRLSSQNSFEIYSSIQRSKFTFANDFPRPDDYVYLEPVNTIAERLRTGRCGFIRLWRAYPQRNEYGDTKDTCRQEKPIAELQKARWRNLRR